MDAFPVTDTIASSVTPNRVTCGWVWWCGPLLRTARNLYFQDPDRAGRELDRPRPGPSDRNLLLGELGNRGLRAPWSRAEPRGPE